MANIVNGHDLDTQSGRADYRASGGWVEGNSSGGGYSYEGGGASGSGGGSQTPTQGATYNTGGGGGGGGGSSGGGGGGGGGGSVPSDGGLQQMLNALAAGNKAAADQAAAQFAQTFGLDTQKFQESVAEYNKNFGLAQAGLTGMYNGQLTLAGQQQAMAQQKQDADIAAQAAGISGLFNGVPTEAAREFNTTTAENSRQFDVTAAQNALNQANQTGLGVLNLASSLHSDPFRQLSVMYGANGIDGVRNAVNGLSGQYGLSGTFTAPGAAGNTATLGGAVGAFNNAPAQYQAAQGILSSFPTANQIIARNYNSAPQNVQDFTTSALSANNGLDQASNDKLIQNTLPKFHAPSFGLATV